MNKFLSNKNVVRTGRNQPDVLVQTDLQTNKRSLCEKTLTEGKYRGDTHT